MKRRWVEMVRERYSTEERQLNLGNHKISNWDIHQIIAACTGLTNEISKLYLKRNEIETEGAKYLASSLKKLTELSLSLNDIGPQGVMHLTTSNLSNLSQLYLMRNNIGVRGIKYLINGDLVSLKILSVACNGIGNEGVKYFTNGHLKKLTELNLSKNEIGLEGVKSICTAELNSLEVLNRIKLELKGPNLQVPAILSSLHNFT